jgi:hypothetical protein
MRIDARIVLASCICLLSATGWGTGLPLGQTGSPSGAGPLPVQDHPRGPYFGQTPPGVTPEPCAPGFICTPAYEFAGTFSPDEGEFFFTRRPDAKGAENRLYYTRQENGVWTPPRPASFGRDVMEFEPHITPSGDRVYFSSKRAKPAGTTSRGDIWYSERTSSGWSEARYLDGPINDGTAMYISATRDGTLYFTGLYGRRFGIFRSRQVNGRFSEPEYLPETINSIRPAHPFIAPDESFLLIDAQTSGPLKPELYVSFRRADGTWTPARKLGPAINTTATEYAPSVSPDGKYLFFHRLDGVDGQIYWVDVRMIGKPESN